MPRMVLVTASIVLWIALAICAHAQPPGPVPPALNTPAPNMPMRAAPAFAPRGWAESFEGPNPSWRPVGGDANYRLVQHRRVQGVAHGGQSCEWLQLQGDGGSAVYVGHEVGHARVIDELQPSVWVKSDRAGLQIVAEIVLPQTLDPRTGRALATQISGSTYTLVGHWQQLQAGDLPRMLMRQLRIVRSQLKSDVDARDAYLNRVVLNIYGGPGMTNVWIDDLEVNGFVAAPAAAGTAAAPMRPEVQPKASASSVPVAAPTPPRTVELVNSVILARGRPLLPLAIQYQGERLTTLKQLGFNTVWLRQAPEPEFLAEAQRLGLWLVCPPPRPAAEWAFQGAGEPLAGSMTDPSRAPVPVGSEFQPVLAWDLGSGLAGEQLEATRQWAQYVRLADARQQRPLICAPMNDLRGFSRYVDLLLIHRKPLGTSLEMPDYGAWIRRQPLLARPGTPAWSTVQTQPSDALRRQLAALDPDRPLPGAVSPEQIRLLVYTAIACGSRGLVFQSQSSLEAGDADTRQRAMALQLLNLELELIGPWMAGGSFTATAETSQAEVSGAVLRSDRARLVLPAWSARGSQCAAPAAVAGNLALVVPGVPESASAFELTAGRLQPLRNKRVAGGMRVTLDEFQLAGLVLLAQDPLVIDAVTRRAGANVRLSAELEWRLAEDRLQRVTQVLQQPNRRDPPGLRADQQLAAARQALQGCKARWAAGDFLSAAAEARRALPALRAVERAHWESALAGLDSPVASPAAASFATLPWHWDLINRAARARVGPNQLFGGDFEDLDAMLRGGWRHYQYAAPGIQAAADLVAEAARSGSRGLRLTARTDDPEHPPALIETPPVWITSPALPVEAGQVVRIHGWANVPAAISGSVDGLMIVDSLAGEDLAERIDKTSGWREFTLYRAAGQSGMMTVTFLLTGLGEARLDDVTIQVMDAGNRGLMQPVSRPSAGGGR